jgi:hypothetical protein
MGIEQGVILRRNNKGSRLENGKVREGFFRLHT